MKFLGITGKIPTATQVRRGVATTVASEKSHGEVEVMSKHLGHLPQTSFRSNCLIHSAWHFAVGFCLRTGITGCFRAHSKACKPTGSLAL